MSPIFAPEAIYLFYKNVGNNRATRNISNFAAALIDEAELLFEFLLNSSAKSALQLLDNWLCAEKSLLFVNHFVSIIFLANLLSFPLIRPGGNKLHQTKFRSEFPTISFSNNATYAGWRLIDTFQLLNCNVDVSMHTAQLLRVLTHTRMIHETFVVADFNNIPINIDRRSVSFIGISVY